MTRPGVFPINGGAPGPSPQQKVAQRVWLTAAGADDLPTVCAAALESAAPHTVVASTTAALLHGLWLPTMPATVHLASAQPGTPGKAMTRTRRAPFVAHRFQLGERDVVRVDGLPVTSIARTWRDLGAILDLPDLVAAGDSALRAGVHRDELAGALACAPRVRGTRLARRALALLDERSRSRAESHLRVAVSGLTVVPFEVNTAVSRAEGGWLAEPDLSLEAAKLALEYQGAEHADLLRMRRDLTRFKDLRDEDWLALAYGPAETFGRPHQIRAEVRRAVWERAPQLLVPAGRRYNRRP